MKLYPDKLEQHFSRGLSPVYLLAGDEPLGVMECGDRIRQAAKEAGFIEREVVVATGDDDWATLLNATSSLSLFSSQRLIELRLPTGKPGRVGSAMLKEYAAAPPQDILLLITTGKLDRSQTSSAWYKSIDKAGVTMTFWPVRANELPGWINQRMKANGLRPVPAAVKMIAERVEGNMLAAWQEIERLSLLYPDQEIGETQVLGAVANSARYSIGDCVDACMQGATVRALKVLQGLRQEAVAAVPILWSLTQEIRGGTRVAQSLAVGMSPAAALKAANVWQSRVPPLQLALSRHTERSWLALLERVSHADRVVKGHAEGDAWEILEEICYRLSKDGSPIIAS